MGESVFYAQEGASRVRLTTHKLCHISNPFLKQDEMNF